MTTGSNLDLLNFHYLFLPWQMENDPHRKPYLYLQKFLASHNSIPSYQMGTQEKHTIYFSMQIYLSTLGYFKQSISYQRLVIHYMKACIQRESHKVISLFLAWLGSYLSDKLL